MYEDDNIARHRKGEIKLAPRDAAPLPFAREEMERSLSERFARVVAAHPHELAIAVGNNRVSYAELDRRCNAIAAAIERHDVASTVAVFSQDRAAMIAATLSAWKAGQICVPLDSALPAARLALVLRHAQAKLVLTDRSSLASLSEIADPGVRVLDIDETFSGTPDGVGGDAATRKSVPADAPACIIYTSGSTGEPKGVVRSHASILHRARCSIGSLAIQPNDRVSAIHSPVTAGGLRDVMAALLGGAALLPFDLKQEGFDGLVRWIERERISVLCAVVSTLRQMLSGLDADVRFPSLRAVRVSSEPLYASDVERLREHVGPDCMLVTGYGATEASGIAEFRIPAVASLPPGRIPAGYALEDVEIAVHDEHGRPVAAGEAGEVIVRSRYLASGYWRRPDLTRAVFTPDPRDAALGCYRTGDIGRRRSDGCLELVGRRDDQVKIRGYRVNPGEIELALVEQPAIGEAVVTSAIAESGETRLVAYVVPRVWPAPMPALLRRHLETRLPAYMIPSAFVAVEALPLTASGKVDRRALPEPPEPESVREGPFVAPRTPTEHQLAAVWEEIFGVTRIGASDDFFDLGGDSLRAASLVAAIDATFGRVLPPSVLLKASKLADLANAIIELQRLDEPITALRASGSGTPIFFLHNDDGRGLYTHALARSLDATRPFYAVHRDGFDGQGAALTVEALATRVAQALRSVRPRGPYVIGGHCNGGAIALEMARQLQDAGEEVELVVMVDTRAPSRGARLRRRLLSVLGPLRRPVIRGLEEQARLYARVYREIGWRARYYRERAAIFAKASLRAQVDFARRKLGSTRRAAPTHDRRGFRFRADGPALDSRRAQSLAVKRYVPPRYPGRVALFRAEEFPAPQPDLGWSALLPRLEVVVVPGDHHTCITRHVAAFAARLDEMLHPAPGGR